MVEICFFNSIFVLFTLKKVWHILSVWW